MTVRNFVLAVLFISATFGLSAQDAAAPAGGTYRSFTPADQWELGVHLGVPFIAGDLDGKLGFGGGLHVRKALDHIFSIRVGGLYAQTKSEDTDNNRSSEMSWFSGSGQLVVTVNNFRFNKPYRKLAVNLFGGLGRLQIYHRLRQRAPGRWQPGKGSYESDLSGQFEFGAGLGFRVNPKFNIGLEYTAISVFGEGADLLDGSNNFGRDVTTFRDFLHYPHLTLNFNLGGNDKKTGAKKSEPLYWANPMSRSATPSPRSKPVRCTIRPIPTATALST
jgi:OOP family OmpA-OmpF porin